MKGLGLIALLIVVALAYSGMTSGSPPAPQVVAAARGDGLPIAFASSETAWPDRPIKAIFNLEPSDNYIEAAWPFAGSRIYFACADGGLAVLRSGAQFAALNGYTSGLNTRYRVRDDRGSTFPILGTSNNQAFRDVGVIKASADDFAVGAWWSALNGRLVKACGS